MTAAVWQQLGGVARLLVEVPASWRALRSPVTRDFLSQDTAAIVRPCAPLLLGMAFAVGGLGVAWMLRAVAPLNSEIAARAARAALVEAGPLFSAVLIVAAVFQLRVAALWAAHRRDEYTVTTRLGIARERVLDVPWMGAHLVSGALGAVAWLATGLLVAPAVNAMLGAGLFFDQIDFLFVAIRPFDPWLTLLHGAFLGAVVGACGLVSAQAAAGAISGIDAISESASVMTRALLLAAASMAVAEVLWWAARWLIGAN